MKRRIYSVINRLAQSIRGSSYAIDPSIPVRDIFRISLSRLSYLIRSFMFFGYSPRSRVFIGPGVSISSKKLLKLSGCVTIGKNSTIAALSKTGIQLGKNVSIGEYCRLEASGTITDIGLGIVIGDNTGIGSHSFVGGAGGVQIGSDVIMGQWVSFHPENHNHEDLEKPIRLQGVNRKGIFIGDDCWIGAKATFLDGAHVGRGCVIAAGAVVRGPIPPYSIAGGVPARVIRSRKSPQAAQ